MEDAPILNSWPGTSLFYYLEKLAIFVNLFDVSHPPNTILPSHSTHACASNFGSDATPRQRNANWPYRCKRRYIAKACGRQVEFGTQRLARRTDQASCAGVPLLLFVLYRPDIPINCSTRRKGSSQRVILIIISKSDASSKRVRSQGARRRKVLALRRNTFSRDRVLVFEGAASRPR